MLQKWTDAVVRARYVVVALWFLAGILGLLSSSGLSHLLTSPLTVPHTGSESADKILLGHLHENVAGTFTVVVPVAQENPRQIAQDQLIIRAAAHQLRDGQVTEQKILAGILYANVNTSLDLSDAAAQTSTLRAALAREGLDNALVTGPPALQHDLSPVLSSDLQRGEIVAVLLALVLLFLVLGVCGAVAVPLLVAGATIAVDIGIVFLLAHQFTMVLFVPNVIELIALGLSIDYTLLAVHRFRHEVADDDVSIERAVSITMATAGRTIAISSAIVAVGLAILCLVPVPFLGSLGLAGFVVPVVALFSALTLLPALLSMLGRRGVRPGRFHLAKDGVATSRWTLFARRVVKRPRSVLAGSAAILVLLVSCTTWLHLTPGSTSAIPQDLASARALSLLSNRIGPGVISPIQIVIDLGGEHRSSTKVIQDNTLQLAQSILPDPGVFAIAIGQQSPFVDSAGRYEQILVVGRDELGAASSQALVIRLRDTYVRHSQLAKIARIYVGGAPAEGVDFLNAVYGAFPWVVALALAVAFLVLMRAFRSLVLAAVSVLLNLVSVAAALGLVVVLTRFGIGRALFGTYQVPQIEGWVPVFLFAVLFGLSMDYEVFLVTRMRESYDAGVTTVEAIVAGITQTGGVVSAAAVIFVGAVAGLIFGQVAALQELGLGLGLGIVVDATIIRGLVLPSVMTLLGRWNWWLPTSAATILRTKPSPLEERGTRAS